MSLSGAFCFGMDTTLASVKNESEEPIRLIILSYSDPNGDVPFPVAASSETSGHMIDVPAEETYTFPDPIVISTKERPDVCLIIGGTILYFSKSDLAELGSGAQLRIANRKTLKWINTSVKLRSSPFETGDNVENE